MRLVMGSDHRGRELCLDLQQFLGQQAHIDVKCLVVDGEIVDYPDVAVNVASAISSGLADFGILICGTGIGMSVVANKFPGVRAAPCHSELTAEFSRRYNDANVLCLSGDMLGQRSCIQIVDKWLATPFEGGRHHDRLEKIREIERHRC